MSSSSSSKSKSGSGIEYGSGLLVKADPANFGGVGEGVVCFLEEATFDDDEDGLLDDFLDDLVLDCKPVGGLVLEGVDEVLFLDLDDFDCEVVDCFCVGDGVLLMVICSLAEDVGIGILDETEGIDNKLFKA